MFDPANELTFATLGAPLSRATNNAATSGLDIRQYEGVLAVRVAIGVKTVGDNDGAITVKLQAAANNTAAEATDITAAGNVATTNNTAASGTLSVDTRAAAAYRYLFARIIIAGTNSPAYPVAIEVVGRKQVQ
jgi:hypothetical protein